MLLERYLATQLARSYRGSVAKIMSPDAVRRLAVLNQLVFTSTALLQKGLPHVSQFFAVQDQTFATKQNALQISGSLCSKSRKPLLRAIRQAAQEAGLSLREIETEQLGVHGLVGKLDRSWYVLGDDVVMQAEGVELGATSQALMQQLELTGKRLYFLAQRGPKRLMAIIACGTELDPYAVDAVHRLRALGLEVSLVSEERERIVQGLCQSAEITQWRSELTPAGKRQVAEQFVQEQPRGGFLCRPADVELVPEHSLITIIGRPQPQASVSIAELGELIDEIERARTLMQQAAKVFFWRKI